MDSNPMPGTMHYRRRRASLFEVSSLQPTAFSALIRTIGVALVLVVCVCATGLTHAQPRAASVITDSIKGKAGAEDKKELGKLFSMLADLAQTPYDIRRVRILGGDAYKGRHPHSRLVCGR